MHTEQHDKGYWVYYKGDAYELIRDGSKFECNGQVGTIKEIKQAIKDETMSAKQHAASEEQHAASEVEKGTWTCVHPCALIVLASSPTNELDLTDEILNTLDAYGWIGPDGKPDVERAAREIMTWGINAKPAK